MVKQKNEYTTPKISVVVADVRSCLCTSNESGIDALIYGAELEFEED